MLGLGSDVKRATSNAGQKLPLQLVTEYHRAIYGRQWRKVS
jgi:hypothetical protein